MLADCPRWNAEEDQIGILLDFLDAHGDELEKVSMLPISLPP
jgi:hypothetical protein